MKEVIIGSFGILLLTGVLIASLNIYSITIHTNEMKGFFRDINNIAKVSSEDFEKETVLEAYVKEMSDHMQIQMKTLDDNDERMLVEISQQIPFVSQKPKIVEMKNVIDWDKKQKICE